MKRIFFILSIFAILAVVYLTVLNTDNIVNVNYVKGYLYTMDPENPYITYSVKLSLYTIVILLAGIFSGAGIVSLFLNASNDKVKAYKRELEKTSVSGEANASKVNVLEAKIKTLEKAFSSVVDERTKMELQIKELNAEIDALNNRG